jgi:hypothetical protein
MSANDSQIAALCAMRDATADPAQRAALDAAIAALQGPAQAPVVDLRGAQTGDAHLGDVAGRDVRKGTEGGVALSDDARLNGVAVGVNLGTIIYGRDPTEDERRRLAWYLHALAGDLRRLPLPQPAPIAPAAIAGLADARRAAPLSKAGVEGRGDGALADSAARAPALAGQIQGGVNVSVEGGVCGSAGGVTGTCRLEGRGEGLN